MFTVQVADAAAAFDTATLNIVVQSAYTVWENQYQLVQGQSGNDDGDRLSHLGQFGLGGNPTNSGDLGYPITCELSSVGGIGPLPNGFVAVTNRIETDLKSRQFIRLIIEKPETKSLETSPPTPHPPAAGFADRAARGA